MYVYNDVMPIEPEQRAQMLQPGPPGPIFMVNLLKFKPMAEYGDGRATTLTGREAYALYAKDVVALLPEFGGVAIFAGDVTFLSLGRVEHLWDEVAIAMYPARANMVRMAMSPAWQAASVHRTAGLEGQLNIETVAAFGAPADVLARMIGATS